MRYIFYYYNHFGTLVFDYYDEETHVSQSYMFYTLKQAVSKFRRDNGYRGYPQKTDQSDEDQVRAFVRPTLS